MDEVRPQDSEHSGAVTIDLSSWRKQLTHNGDRPSEWLAYIQHVVNNILFPSPTKRESYITKLFIDASKRIAEEDKHTIAYIQLNLDFAKFKETVCVSEARELYQMLRYDYKRCALVYIASAQFEIRGGNKDKALKILSKACHYVDDMKEIQNYYNSLVYAGPPHLNNNNPMNDKENVVLAPPQAAAVFNCQPVTATGCRGQPSVDGHPEVRTNGIGQDWSADFKTPGMRVDKQPRIKGRAVGSCDDHKLLDNDESLCDVLSKDDSFSSSTPHTLRHFHSTADCHSASLMSTQKTAITSSHSRRFIGLPRRGPSITPMNANKQPAPPSVNINQPTRQAVPLSYSVVGIGVDSVEHRTRQQHFSSQSAANKTQDEKQAHNMADSPLKAHNMADSPWKAHNMAGSPLKARNIAGSPLNLKAHNMADSPLKAHNMADSPLNLKAHNMADSPLKAHNMAGSPLKANNIAAIPFNVFQPPLERTQSQSDVFQPPLERGVYQLHMTDYDGSLRLRMREFSGSGEISYTLPQFSSTIEFKTPFEKHQPGKRKVQFCVVGSHEDHNLLDNDESSCDVLSKDDSSSSSTPHTLRHFHSTADCHSASLMTAQKTATRCKRPFIGLPLRVPVTRKITGSSPQHSESNTSMSPDTDTCGPSVSNTCGPPVSNTCGPPVSNTCGPPVQILSTTRENDEVNVKPLPSVSSDRSGHRVDTPEKPRGSLKPSLPSIHPRVPPTALPTTHPRVPPTVSSQQPADFKTPSRPTDVVNPPVPPTAPIPPLSNITTLPSPTPASTPTVNVLRVKDKSYTVLNLLGTGGFSKVYQALDMSGHLMAIKCVHLRDAQESVQKSYMNEIKILQRLQYSSRVIKMFDYELNQSAGKLYVVMEKGDTDLASFLKKRSEEKKSLTSLIRASYWQEMLEAVRVLHKEGIVHADLKPANFVLVEGCVKLIDFGIAKAISPDRTSVTDDQPIGTINYMCPEALKGEDDSDTGISKYKVGVKRDVWSLGCILYLMLYNKLPFGHISNMHAKMLAITNPDSTIAFPEHSDCHLVAAVKLCLQRNPKERPTIDELLTMRML